MSTDDETKATGRRRQAGDDLYTKFLPDWWHGLLVVAKSPHELVMLMYLVTAPEGRRTRVPGLVCARIGVIVDDLQAVGMKLTARSARLALDALATKGVLSYEEHDGKLLVFVERALVTDVGRFVNVNAPCSQNQMTSWCHSLEKLPACRLVERVIGLIAAMVGPPDESDTRSIPNTFAKWVASRTAAAREPQSSQGQGQVHLHRQVQRQVLSHPQPAAAGAERENPLVDLLVQVMPDEAWKTAKSRAFIADALTELHPLDVVQIAAWCKLADDEDCKIEHRTASTALSEDNRHSNAEKAADWCASAYLAAEQRTRLEKWLAACEADIKRIQERTKGNAGGRP